MGLPPDVLAGIRIFRIPEGSTGLRLSRRAWKHLAPHLPAAIDRFIDDLIEHVPNLRASLTRDRQLYKDLVIRHTESLFNYPLSERQLVEAKERVTLEIMLGFDMRSRATISEAITEGLIAALRESRWVSKHAMLDMIELTTRLLGIDTVGGIALHYQAKAREAKTKALELGQAIQNFAQTIQAGRGLATSSISSLSQTASELTHLARHGAEQAETAAVAANDTASNVARMANATEELFASINDVRRQAMASVHMAQNAVGQSGETNGTILFLSEAVEKIGSFVGVISEIAASTNMLALNATIEASRAGDAGRGFAVVAGEVKSLARQTSQATQEISKQIAMIQDATHRSVEQIGMSTQAISGIAGIAEAVAHSVDQQAGATGSIAEGVNGAARNATTVADALRTIEDTVRRTRDASQAALDLSERLAESARASSAAMDTLFKAAAKHDGMRKMRPITTPVVKES